MSWDGANVGALIPAVSTEAMQFYFPCLSCGAFCEKNKNFDKHALGRMSIDCGAMQ